MSTKNKSNNQPVNQGGVDTQQNQNDMKEIKKLMQNTKVYYDKNFDFNFSYPHEYSIESHISSSTGEYFVKDASSNIAHIKFMKWKGYVIKEGTPGAEYEKRAYSDWKYIADDFDNIQVGECGQDLIAHVPGATMASVPKTCIVNREDGKYVKIETESSMIYYTKDAEILLESSPKNFNLTKEIALTLKV